MPMREPPLPLGHGGCAHLPFRLFSYGKFRPGVRFYDELIAPMIQCRGSRQWHDNNRTYFAMDTISDESRPTIPFKCCRFDAEVLVPAGSFIPKTPTSQSAILTKMSDCLIPSSKHKQVQRPSVKTNDTTRLPYASAVMEPAAKF